MCFSAEASFVTAAVLIPVGLACLKESISINKSYWAFALLPFLFGFQQVLEGVVWLTLDGRYEYLLRPAAFGFLFFSHFLWLLWIPLSGFLTETNKSKRKLFFVVTVVGMLFGGTMFIPLLLQPDWVSVSVQQHSIYYDVRIIYDALLPRDVLTLIYALIILVPLLLSSDRYHKVLGVLVTVSGLLTWGFFGLAFISVWCFFAAVISSYIFYQVVLTKHKLPSN
ncbi:MAG: hypothetical protein KAT25_05670 [Sulfuriflexus sp.]|nr:hypothetical protein [Sulfuriflexus sp.]